MSNAPTHATIYDLVITKRLRDVRVALPGRIESYDRVTQKATVQPLIQELSEDDLGNPVIQSLPVATDVPVLFPGAGQWRITGPVKSGDTVMLLFASSSIDQWKARGGLNNPDNDRHHDLSDAVALLGVYDFGHVPTDAPNDAVVVHASTLKLGASDATDPVVRKSDLDAVVTRLKAHGHSGAGAIDPTTAAFTTPACSPVTKSK